MILELNYYAPILLH